MPRDNCENINSSKPAAEKPTLPKEIIFSKKYDTDGFPKSCLTINQTIC